jgi:hypothetical protein
LVKLHIRGKKSCIISIKPSRKIDLDSPTISNGENEGIIIIKVDGKY